MKCHFLHAKVHRLKTGRKDPALVKQRCKAIYNTFFEPRLLSLPSPIYNRITRLVQQDSWDIDMYDKAVEGIGKLLQLAWKVSYLSSGFYRDWLASRCAAST